MTFLYLLLTLAVGTACGLLANKLKIPGGLMVGAIVGVALLNIVFETAFMPKQTKLLVQIIAGAFIGCIMEKSDLRRLPHIVKPASIMIMGLLLLNIIAGITIWLVSPLDLLTSLMSVVPGGISDTPIIASIMGADGPKVAVMQVIRQILGIGVFPSMILYYDTRKKLLNPETDKSGYKEKRVKSNTKSLPAILCTLLIATISGLLGTLTSIPAGSFICAILAVLLLKLAFNFATIPKWLKKGAQVLSGCYLGSLIGISDVLELKYLLLPLLIIIIGYMLNCFLTGAVIKRTCHFTRKESMLITTPAGASDMALISTEIGVENTDVIILQVVRAIVVMTIFPQIMSLIVLLIN